MAIYKLFPEQDTSLYSEYSDMNTGRDEILEVGSYYKGDVGYVSRTLIQFNTEELAEVLDNFVAPSTGNATDFSASLKLSLASANELPTNYILETWPVYANGVSSWTVGNGKYGDLPRNTSGTSWFFSGPGTSAWTTTTNVTQSYSGSFLGGASWYTGSAGIDFEATQSHPVNSTHDVNINITQGVKAHYSGIISNAGFVVKLANTHEFQTNYQTTLKYFSSNTHTIYPPHLEIKWDDSEYQTTLPVITDSNAVIKIKNNRGEYTDEGRQRFELTVRPKYPTRTFVTSSSYLTNHRLPATSYWGLRDENTEEMVIDFDNDFTKISTSTSSSYFDIYMGGLEPERYYRVLVKTTINGSTNIIDENLVFKVVRNG